MKFTFPAIIVGLLHLQPACAQPIGHWGLSAAGLPVYQYTGALPFRATDKDGKDANLPEDPYFLLGNYRMGLLTHVSGTYQLLTAERAWARINAAGQTNYGWNDAAIGFKTNGQTRKVILTGINSIAADPALVQKSFGVGVAKYTYQLENQVSCTRTLSVKPSPKINLGNPAFAITVTLKNNGSQPQQLTYTERMLVNFVLNSTQCTDKEKRPFSYSAAIHIDATKQLAIADVGYKANEFLVVPSPTERYPYDVAPPSVFMYAKKPGGDYMKVERGPVVTATNDTLATTVNTALKPGQTTRFTIVIGLTKGNRRATNGRAANGFADVNGRAANGFADVKTQVADLFLGAGNDPSEGLFVQPWKAKLPDLSAEKNEIFRREMLWNAHMIEASAKYSAYYQETFIPQGTVYSYYFGDNISNRDHLQAALAACYTNPELAKSILRYVIKHSGADFSQVDRRAGKIKKCTGCLIHCRPNRILRPN